MHALCRKEPLVYIGPQAVGLVYPRLSWHLIQLKETREAAKPTLEEVREELAAGIEQKAIADHIAALEGAATISRPGDTFDPAVIKNADLLGQ